MEILLTSENKVRSITNIDNNVQSKYLLSAIREAQDFGLQTIIGTALFEKLMVLVANGGIEYEVNAGYKALLDYAQIYLAYKTVANLCLITSVKISNGGLQQTSDENLTVLNIEDTWEIEKHYTDKSDFYAKRLQAYILQHRSELPELSENDCQQIHSNLYSAGSTSIFLGGARGRKNNKRYLL